MWNHCLTRATHQSFVGLFSHCALSACSISFSPSFTDLLLPFIIFSADIFKANKTYNSNDLQLGACFPMEPCALFANAQVHDVVGNAKGSYVVSKTSSDSSSFQHKLHCARLVYLVCGQQGCILNIWREKVFVLLANSVCFIFIVIVTLAAI